MSRPKGVQLVLPGTTSRHPPKHPPNRPPSQPNPPQLHHPEPFSQPLPPILHSISSVFTEGRCTKQWGTIQPELTALYDTIDVTHKLDTSLQTSFGLHHLNSQSNSASSRHSPTLSPSHSRAKHTAFDFDQQFKVYEGDLGFKLSQLEGFSSTTISFDFSSVDLGDFPTISVPSADNTAHVDEDEGGNDHSSHSTSLYDYSTRIINSLHFSSAQTSVLSTSTAQLAKEVTKYCESAVAETRQIRETALNDINLSSQSYNAAVEPLLEQIRTDSNQQLQVLEAYKQQWMNLDAERRSQRKIWYEEYLSTFSVPTPVAQTPLQPSTPVAAQSQRMTDDASQSSQLDDNKKLEEGSMQIQAIEEEAMQTMGQTVIEESPAPAAPVTDVPPPQTTSQSLDDSNSNTSQLTTPVIDLISTEETASNTLAPPNSLESEPLPPQPPMSDAVDQQHQALPIQIDSQQPQQPHIQSDQTAEEKAQEFADRQKKRALKFKTDDSDSEEERERNDVGLHLLLEDDDRNGSDGGCSNNNSHPMSQTPHSAEQDSNSSFPPTTLQTSLSTTISTSAIPSTSAAAAAAAARKPTLHGYEAYYRKKVQEALEEAKARGEISIWSNDSLKSIMHSDTMHSLVPVVEIAQVIDFYEEVEALVGQYKSLVSTQVDYMSKMNMVDEAKTVEQKLTGNDSNSDGMSDVAVFSVISLPNPNSVQLSRLSSEEQRFWGQNIKTMEGIEFKLDQKRGRQFDAILKTAQNRGEARVNEYIAAYTQLQQTPMKHCDTNNVLMDDTSSSSTSPSRPPHQPVEIKNPLTLVLSPQDYEEKRAFFDTKLVDVMTVSSDNVDGFSTNLTSINQPAQPHLRNQQAAPSHPTPSHHASNLSFDHLIADMINPATLYRDLDPSNLQPPQDTPSANTSTDAIEDDDENDLEDETSYTSINSLGVRSTAPRRMIIPQLYDLQRNLPAFTAYLNEQQLQRDNAKLAEIMQAEANLPPERRVKTIKQQQMMQQSQNANKLFYQYPYLCPPPQNSRIQRPPVQLLDSKVHYSMNTGLDRYDVARFDLEGKREYLNEHYTLLGYVPKNAQQDDREIKAYYTKQYNDVMDDLNVLQEQIYTQFNALTNTHYQTMEKVLHIVTGNVSTISPDQALLPGHGGGHAASQQQSQLQHHNTSSTPLTVLSQSQLATLIGQSLLDKLNQHHIDPTAPSTRLATIQLQEYLSNADLYQHLKQKEASGNFLAYFSNEDYPSAVGEFVPPVRTEKGSPASCGVDPIHHPAPINFVTHNPYHNIKLPSTRHYSQLREQHARGAVKDKRGMPVKSPTQQQTDLPTPPISASDLGVNEQTYLLHDKIKQRHQDVETKLQTLISAFPRSETSFIDNYRINMLTSNKLYLKSLDGMYKRFQKFNANSSHLYIRPLRHFDPSSHCDDKLGVDHGNIETIDSSMNDDDLNKIDENSSNLLLSTHSRSQNAFTSDPYEPSQKLHSHNNHLRKSKNLPKFYCFGLSAMINSLVNFNLIYSLSTSVSNPELFAQLEASRRKNPTPDQEKLQQIVAKLHRFGTASRSGAGTTPHLDIADTTMMYRGIPVTTVPLGQFQRFSRLLKEMLRLQARAVAQTASGISKDKDAKDAKDLKDSKDNKESSKDNDDGVETQKEVRESKDAKEIQQQQVSASLFGQQRPQSNITAPDEHKGGEFNIFNEKPTATTSAAGFLSNGQYPIPQLVHVPAHAPPGQPSQYVPAQYAYYSQYFFLDAIRLGMLSGRGRLLGSLLYNCSQSNQPYTQSMQHIEQTLAKRSHLQLQQQRRAQHEAELASDLQGSGMSAKNRKRKNPEQQYQDVLDQQARARNNSTQDGKSSLTLDSNANSEFEEEQFTLNYYKLWNPYRYNRDEIVFGYAQPTLAYSTELTQTPALARITRPATTPHLVYPKVQLQRVLEGEDQMNHSYIRIPNLFALGSSLHSDQYPSRTVQPVVQQGSSTVNRRATVQPVSALDEIISKRPVYHIPPITPAVDTNDPSYQRQFDVYSAVRVNTHFGGDLPLPCGLFGGSWVGLPLPKDQGTNTNAYNYMDANTALTRGGFDNSSSTNSSLAYFNANASVGLTPSASANSTDESIVSNPTTTTTTTTRHSIATPSLTQRPSLLQSTQHQTYSNSLGSVVIPQDTFFDSIVVYDCEGMPILIPPNTIDDMTIDCDLAFNTQISFVDPDLNKKTAKKAKPALVAQPSTHKASATAPANPLSPAVLETKATAVLDGRGDGRSGANPTQQQSQQQQQQQQQQHLSSQPTQQQQSQHQHSHPQQQILHPDQTQFHPSAQHHPQHSGHPHQQQQQLLPHMQQQHPPQQHPLQSHPSQHPAQQGPPGPNPMQMHPHAHPSHPAHQHYLQQQQQQQQQQQNPNAPPNLIHPGDLRSPQHSAHPQQPLLPQHPHQQLQHQLHHPHPSHPSQQPSHPHSHPHGPPQHPNQPPGEAQFHPNDPHAPGGFHPSSHHPHNQPYPPPHRGDPMHPHGHQANVNPNQPPQHPHDQPQPQQHPGRVHPLREQRPGPPDHRTGGLLPQDQGNGRGERGPPQSQPPQDHRANQPLPDHHRGNADPHRLDSTKNPSRSNDPREFPSRNDRGPPGPTPGPGGPDPREFYRGPPGGHSGPQPPYHHPGYQNMPPNGYPPGMGPNGYPQGPPGAGYHHGQMPPHGQPPPGNYPYNHPNPNHPSNHYPPQAQQGPPPPHHPHAPHSHPARGERSGRGGRNDSADHPPRSERRR